MPPSLFVPGTSLLLYPSVFRFFYRCQVPLPCNQKIVCCV
jgi:hypothetical protein